MTTEVGCCTKYFLFFFNILFWIVGLFLLGAGIWAWSEKGFFDRLTKVGALPIDPVLVIMIVAFIIFTLSLTGCLGSLRENICLLKFFSICLGVIFFAELIAGILGFVYKDWFQSQFALFVNKTIKGYREDPDLQNIIDFSQTFLQCCGGDTGTADWDNNVYFNCSSQIEINGRLFTPAESCGVPFSCCLVVPGQEVDVIDTHCGYGVRKDDAKISEQMKTVYTTGCLTMFEDWLKMNLYTVAGVFIGIALLQIVPICMAQNMISDIESIKARWQR
ncbi:tetraspanin-5-like [Styela clava]|uniref:tetraspanin-5-like n=1 Tax=Styela clava TaxID=7725 RepID=UPI00193A2886|nr:tetraspanin-5-like [Styela clava]